MIELLVTPLSVSVRQSSPSKDKWPKGSVCDYLQYCYLSDIKKAQKKMRYAKYKNLYDIRCQGKYHFLAWNIFQQFVPIENWSSKSSYFSVLKQYYSFQTLNRIKIQKTTTMILSGCKFASLKFWNDVTLT